MYPPSCASPTTPDAARRSRTRRLLRVGALVLLIWPAWEFSRFAFNGNIHEVIPSKLYRGGQPSARSLEGIIKKYGIRTVLNVRGCCFPDDWYVSEAEVCQRLGVYLEDVTFSAVHFPSRDELRALVEVLERTAAPIFVHCRQGSDRTGMTAAVAVLLLTDQSYDAARYQLGLRFGHLSIGRTGLLDKFLDLYGAWLEKEHVEHSQARFRHWVLDEYRGGKCDAHFEKVQRLFKEARVGRPLDYTVVVRNTGNEAWQFQPGLTAGFHVTFKILDANENFQFEGRAGLLDRRVEPGETIQVAMMVPAIAKAGVYHLVVDMVEEGHCWFHQTGSEPWEEELVIRE